MLRRHRLAQRPHSLCFSVLLCHSPLSPPLAQPDKKTSGAVCSTLLCYDSYLNLPQRRLCLSTFRVPSSWQFTSSSTSLPPFTTVPIPPPRQYDCAEALISLSSKATSINISNPTFLYPWNVPPHVPGQLMCVSDLYCGCALHHSFRRSFSIPRSPTPVLPTTY